MRLDVPVPVRPIDVVAIVSIELVMMAALVLATLWVFGVFDRRERRPKPEPDGTLVVPLDRFTCTYCGCHGYLEGPSGGMMTNIVCANKDCHQMFNWCPELGICDDLNRKATA